MEKFSKFGILPVHRLTLNQNWKQMPNQKLDSKRDYGLNEAQIKI